ncbi:hypothetical protein GGS23DRAFT_33601 [Durotheca rogersii]|uniref:uncharacterized protein n=1 Tax=Durotheca rogersii TaxID=419775 RepID=UPI0022200E41|nr:uncharacterized protein GGS23DRAFT_33601 [Durotheca rogersii]KAI5868493.1 hypothetical protein GGS23DRAFT_33601 [Durotheca rogersii]
MVGTGRHASAAPVIILASITNPMSNIATLDTESFEHLDQNAAMASSKSLCGRKATGRMGWMARAAVLSLLSTAPGATAQDRCIPLTGSTTCSAFQSASVSTNSFLVGLFPFLQYVSDTASFDRQFSQYLQTDYVRRQYQTLLGCGSIDLVNTTDLYARFTTSVICNAIIQNSVTACGLSERASRPLCADSCAHYAESEAYLAADTNLCPSSSNNRQDQIRADFVNCALPADSLSSSSCIQGIANEPDNCGYGSSTIGLCSYCASGGINSTDTCCYNSNVEQRCANVVLPTITSTITFGAPTSTATSDNTATPVEGESARGGLSGGAIAGIVVGSLAGVALLAILAFMCIRLRGRRGGSQKGSVLNQPSPTRKGLQTAQIPANTAPQGYEILPGGRIARMSALEGHSGESSSRRGGSKHTGSMGGTAAAGAAGGFMAGRRRGGDNHSSSDSFGESPGSEARVGVLRPPPMNIRRNGSLSSNSVLAGEDPQSPTSAGGMSSPPGVNSQQSEQLPFFKDYYSQDDIHPGEHVAVLWAYQPRASDEFSLERGDMLKVVGIWDDGWATGVLLDERADEWEARRQAQRDSGVSHTSGRGRDTSPPISGEIKAFPLVCVCLPEHWRKTIDGDGSTETGSSARHHGSHPT